MVPQINLLRRKRCSVCREWKSHGDFYVRSARKEGHSPECKNCNKIRRRTPERLERRAIIVSDWKKANADKVNASARRTYQRHKEIIAARAKAKGYTEAARARNRAKYDADPKAAIATVLAWKKRNKQTVNANNARRRARRKNAEGSFTNEEWFALCQRYGGKCLRCGEVKPMSIDHVLPLSLGGSNWISNIQPLCKSCNSWKHDQYIDYR